MTDNRPVMIRFYGFLVLGVLLEGTADLLFRKWGIERSAGAGNWNFFLMSLAIYAAGAVCWGLSLQFREVSRGIVTFMVLNVVMVAAAGVWLYGERISTVNRIGILL